MRWLHLCVVVLVLIACGTTPTPQSVVSAIGAVVPVADVTEGRIPADSPVPQSYTGHVDFTVGGLGGQAFVCDTKRNCDAIYAYYDAFKALVGPYLYQSDRGTVVVQMNSGLLPETAAKIEGAVKGL